MSCKVYIRSASQISAQEPLCEDWMESPVVLEGEYVPSIDPDYRQFFSPMQARRMGKLLKRAMATSLTAMKEGGIECPDAIVTGTGLGCIENTDLFLDAMVSQDEEMLPPTQFMQSTHNTISSLVAIQTHCHGYNCTYSQGDISFESALLDAFVQLKAGSVRNALVGSHDETPPVVKDLLAKSGYLDGSVPATEGSVAMMLTTVPDKVLCEVADVRLFFKAGDLMEKAKAYGAECIMTSKEYSRTFGRNFSASGLGVYAAAHLMAAGRHSSMVVVNDSGIDGSIVYLRRPCGNC